MDFFNNSTINSTLSPMDENEIYRRNLKKACSVVAISSLCVIMLGMGTDILWKQIWKHLRRPVAIVIGILSQFVVMPLIGFLVINVMTLSPAHAISILLMSCCPGGAVSNIFTYFVDGDVPLSVTMTSLSTLFALGFMPFNIWFYGTWVETGEITIPYASIATSLVYVTSPACLGMIIRWKSPAVAAWITKVFSIMGFGLIAIYVTLQSLAHPNLFTNIPSTLYIAATAIPTVGFICGFSLAWVLRQPLAVRKTISLESGIQNAAVAFGVISVSPFEFDVQESLLVFPTMYALFMIFLCFFFCSIYQLYKKMCKEENGDKIQGEINSAVVTFDEPKIIIEQEKQPNVEESGLECSPFLLKDSQEREKVLQPIKDLLKLRSEKV